MSARRIAAIGAQILGLGAFALAVVAAGQEFPRRLIAPHLRRRRGRP